MANAKLLDISNWAKTATGIYRFKAMSNLTYEIIMSSNKVANLYYIWNWNGKSGMEFERRPISVKSNIDDCLKEAFADFKTIDEIGTDDGTFEPGKPIIDMMAVNP